MSRATNIRKLNDQWWQEAEAAEAACRSPYRQVTETGWQARRSEPTPKKLCPEGGGGSEPRDSWITATSRWTINSTRLTTDN